MKRKVLSILTCTTLVFIGACAGLGSSSGSNINVEQQEVHVQDQISNNFIKNQPVPVFPYSQLRQNLKEIEKAQAEGVQTTSFFFNLGTQDPIDSCPSIGTPIQQSDSLTNPTQPIRDSSQPLNNGGGNVVLDQMEPTGIYPGQGTGTYIICLGANGQEYANYWEGYVYTVFAPAKWNYTQHHIELVGSSSFNFSHDKASAGVK